MIIAIVKDINRQVQLSQGRVSQKLDYKIISQKQTYLLLSVAVSFYIHQKIRLKNLGVCYTPHKKYYYQIPRLSYKDLQDLCDIISAVMIISNIV